MHGNVKNEAGYKNTFYTIAEAEIVAQLMQMYQSLAK